MIASAADPAYFYISMLYATCMEYPEMWLGGDTTLVISDETGPETYRYVSRKHHAPRP